MTDLEKYRELAQRMRDDALSAEHRWSTHVEATIAITELCDRLVVSQSTIHHLEQSVIEWKDRAGKLEAVERSTLERCAKLCDDYAVDQLALFEGRPPHAANDSGCRDPEVLGESIGAECCADLIREFMKEEK